MAQRSAIVGGGLFPVYVVELGQRSAIDNGVYVIENGQAVATASASIGNLTLSANAAVLVLGSGVGTIGEITATASANIAVTASLIENIGNIALDAVGKTVVSASLDASMGEITSEAIGHVISRADAAVPWWWRQYILRHAEKRRQVAERAAAVRPELIDGDGIGEIPMPYGRGTAFHDPDEPVIRFLSEMFPEWLQAA
jgi:hypothetical protein